MEKKPASVRMLESLFECEQPHTDFAYVDLAGWQRKGTKHGETERRVQSLESKGVRRMSPKASTQESAQQE